MEQVERIGISVDRSLLARFDELIRSREYQSRSEAIRDLIRSELTRRSLEDADAEALAIVSVVFDHHATQLMQKLTTLQHSHLLQAIGSLHVHLGATDCMEVILLKGRIGEITKIGENIISRKGVKLGHINTVPLK